MGRPREPKVTLPRTAREHEKRLCERVMALVAAMNDALAAGYEFTQPVLRRERRFACDVIEIDRAPRVSGSDVPPEEDAA